MDLRRIKEPRIPGAGNMKVCREIEMFPEIGKPVVLAIGSFDGIHLGHQAIIRSALAKASALGGEAWLMTFHPHPRAVLKPDEAPLLISPGAQQLALLESMQLDGVIQVPFTQELASLSPEAFWERLILHIPDLRAIFVGRNFRFGAHAAGDGRLLAELAENHGRLEVMITEDVVDQAGVISSSRIRAAVQDGDFSLVGKLLGRDFVVRGEVIDGRKHGRQIGFPTANVRPESRLLPPPGIYALRVYVDHQAHPAAGYIGANDRFLVEAHLLDFKGDLYGKVLEITFVRHVRDHEDFESQDALTEQIASDVRKVREILQQSG